MGDSKQHFSFGFNQSANQKNYSTSWELQQKKTFIKLILIGKAEDVHGKWLFGSDISESWWLHSTRNYHYHEILGLELHILFS